MSHTGDVLNAPLSILGLSIRITNALLNDGITTVGDLVAKTETELWDIAQVGATTMTDIKEKLRVRGLALHP